MPPDTNGRAPGGGPVPAHETPAQLPARPAHEPSTTQRPQDHAERLPALVGDCAKGEAALRYAALGWPVFPVHTGGKVPLTRHGCKDASTDPAVVRAWWQRHPTANIGVATGPASGLLVVDVDPAPGGYGALAELEAGHGALATLEAGTPAGGAHLYLRYPPGRQLGNSAGRLAAGLDTRGAGGYVVAPPSRRSEGRYVWSVDPDPVMPPPDWLLDLLDPPPPPRQPVSQPAPGPADDRRLLARFDGLLDVIGEATPGQRNNRLHWCACRLRELLAEGAPPGWVELLVAAGVAMGLPRAEARKTVTSGLEGTAR
jgi:Bifunctional DNA primase/polymerase, N-terminal